MLYCLIKIWTYFKNFIKKICQFYRIFEIIKKILWIHPNHQILINVI